MSKTGLGDVRDIIPMPTMSWQVIRIYRHDKTETRILRSIVQRGVSSRAAKQFTRSTTEDAHANMGVGPLFVHLLIVPLNPRASFAALCSEISICVGALNVPERLVGCGSDCTCEYLAVVETSAVRESGSCPLLGSATLLSA